MLRTRLRALAGGCAVLLVVVLLGFRLDAQSTLRFQVLFENKTMRVDYVHSGGLGEEIVALDQVVSDGAWAGSRTRLVDDLNLGKYLFEVIDRRTNQVVYSRGFASIYGEWETPSEARERFRSFHES